MMSSSTVKAASEEVLDRFLANVDVWQAIFEMLEVKDRIRLEMTNKRLRTVMFVCWKRLTSFDTKSELMSDSLSMSRNPWKLSAAFVAICVDRIGDGLRSLTIREKFPMAVSSPIFRLIGEGCPNVETINFVFTNFVEDEFLSVWTLHNGVDSLSRLIRFYSFPRLKTLTDSTPRQPWMLRFTAASASIFLSISTSIEVIRELGGTMEEPFDNAAQMEGFFADRPSLREVCLGELQTRDRSKADIFRVIAERCPHLKSIELASFNDCIDYRGVVALDEMKELRTEYGIFNEMEIVTICERSPFVEALVFCVRFSSDLDLQSASLNALGALTKLALCSSPYADSEHVVTPPLVADFFRELARNSGASLRYLDLPKEIPLPTAAIEALANGCRKLRDVKFCVFVGEATPASIRFLIDSIVAHPSWIPQTGERTLVIEIDVIDDAEAGFAAFQALAAPAANLPDGVQLLI